ncbi:MAG: folylpolyglutamate synthase/dihydrofolate synthase family protein [Planctomycetota bacterium]|nr:folylpolyglutamate synthase/dihydrofolate synthase family protein [Planctomycetota bacterium]
MSKTAPSRGRASSKAKPEVAKPKVTVKPAKPSAKPAVKPVAKKSKATFANYQAALKFLYDRMDIERTRASRIDPKVFKLDRMRQIMEELGNPQEALRCIHVAGTNGKGSICAMLTSCLRSCGYTVGTYTSPHLMELRERIVINGSMISHQAFTDIMGRVASAVAALPAKLGEPTFFEVITAVAFVHFAEQAVDAAVIEVGLGGRLDSTNIITPEVAVIGSIGMDHMQILGNTLDKIAYQKAGIFKKDIPALTFQQDKLVIETLRSAAAEAGAHFQVVGDDIEFSFRFETNPQLGPHMRVGLSTDRCTYEHIPVPLPGEHQAYNCGLVLAVLDKLAERGFELPESKVVQGLESVQIPGRMELAWKEPRIMLDGAHNAPALTALMKSIGAHVPYDSMIVIFGCAADKDLEELLKRVAIGADKVIFTASKGNARAADPKELARMFVEQTGKMCQSAETLDEALSIAVRAAGRDDLVCITGSFYLVGEAKKLLAEKAGKALRPDAG